MYKLSKHYRYLSIHFFDRYQKNEEYYYLDKGVGKME